MASRCSFHFGSIRLIRMCSAISFTGISSPVMGDTTSFVASFFFSAAGAARL